ncbi:imelysin family protein [Ramlibacter sp. AN1015]|uniref:imelysin family protein n=1 Tax=Ramlibacter sp. AN1015 TaxID=3133428 RepID=UPI0030BE860F
MNTRALSCLTVAAALLAGGSPSWVAAGPASVGGAAAPTRDEVARHYAALVHASYSDALAAARHLQKAVDAFVRAPSAAALDTARKAWLAGREVYGQTEAFRFYGGPIDDESGREGRLNAWPMDESYVDSVAGRPGAGLVNDRKADITKQALAAMNERGGEENVATGWHAIEFMLWGQDTFDDGPGRRDFQDFVDGKAPNADRRRRYLQTVTELLVDDLQSLVKAWAPGVQGNYRARLERGGQESLRRMVVGLGSLSRGELAGERLEVALSTQDQEDEHSCFSDNTHRDAVTNARGVQNVWLGSYRRADGSVLQGPSLRALVASTDAALAERTTRQIAASVAATEAIRPPFDQEIRGGADAPGRRRVQAAIDSLTRQSKDLVDAARAIGIRQLNLVQP